jgi:predicted lipid-binding transport protein (Tim44 family)
MTDPPLDQPGNGSPAPGQTGPAGPPQAGQPTPGGVDCLVAGVAAVVCFGLAWIAGVALWCAAIALLVVALFLSGTAIDFCLQGWPRVRPGPDARRQRCWYLAGLIGGLLPLVLLLVLAATSISDFFRAVSDKGPAAAQARPAATTATRPATRPATAPATSPATHPAAPSPATQPATRPADIH